MRLFNRSLGKLAALPVGFAVVLAAVLLANSLGCPPQPPLPPKHPGGSDAGGVGSDAGGVGSDAGYSVEYKSRPSWDECKDDGLNAMACTNRLINPGITEMDCPGDGDPGGNGQELLGVGIKLPSAKQPFMRIDRFALNRVWKVESGNRIPVQNVTIDNMQLAGKIMRNGSLEDVRDWNGIIFEGKTRCVNSNLQNYDKYPYQVTIGETQKMNANDVYGIEGHPGDIPVYELRLEDGTSACKDTGDVAFPIPGYFATNGEYIPHPTAKEFSFACVKRDVAKCLRQGYSAKAAGDSERKVIFEACTRMMRADYCGTGKSFTKDGSLVREWDMKDINTKQNALKGLQGEVKFEGAWLAKGLACINQFRYPDPDLNPRASGACPQTTKFTTCGSPEEAIKAHKNDGRLLFNYSCVTHPCGCEPNCK